MRFTVDTILQYMSCQRTPSYVEGVTCPCREATNEGEVELNDTRVSRYHDHVPMTRRIRTRDNDLFCSIATIDREAIHYEIHPCDGLTERLLTVTLERFL